MKNVQSVLIPRTTYTVTQARAWLKSHGYKSTGKVDSTPRYHRFRQVPPSTFKRYRIYSLAGTGIRLVLGYKL